MSWVCRNCSSSNALGTYTCFVCGLPRPAESIARERDALRAEKREKLLNGFCEKIFPAMRMTALICLAATSFVIFAGTVLSVLQGQSESLPIAMKALSCRAAENVRTLSEYGNDGIFNDLISAKLNRIAGCTELISEHFLSGVKELFVSASNLYENYAKNRFIHSYNVCTAIAEHAGLKLDSVEERLSELHGLIIGRIF